jgi:Rap1a immunity proteins
MNSWERITVVVVVLAMSAVGAVRHANAQANASELLAQCEVLERGARVEGELLSLPRDPSAQVCYGFISAIQDLSALTDSVDGPTLTGACLPPEGTLLQLVRVFTKYARTNPAELDQKAGLVVIKAFWRAFPCRVGIQHHE